MSEIGEPVPPEAYFPGPADARRARGSETSNLCTSHHEWMGRKVSEDNMTVPRPHLDARREVLPQTHRETPMLLHEQVPLGLAVRHACAGPQVANEQAARLQGSVNRHFRW